jgi:hypothetical protein
MPAELAAQAKAAKVKSICSELGTPARMMRIALVRSGYATEYVACLGPGALGEM